MTVIKLCWNLFEVAQEYKIKVLCTTKSWVLSLESCSYWMPFRIFMLKVYGWLQEANRMGTSYFRAFTTEKFGQDKSQSSRCHEKNVLPPSCYLWFFLFLFFNFQASHVKEGGSAGLIPSQFLEEKRKAFVRRDWDNSGEI